MADQETADAFVHHAFLGRDGDLTADLHVAAFVGAMGSTVADRKSIAPGLFEEIDRLHRIGVGACRGENVAQSGVYVDINAFVGGFGSNRGEPAKKYTYMPVEYVLHFSVLPVAGNK